MSKTGKAELYKSFVEAYKNAHPMLTKASTFHKAQGAWNEMKHDPEMVKQKIHEWKAMAAKHHSNKLTMWAGFFKSPKTSTSDQPSASGGSNIGKNNTEKGHQSCPSSSDQKLSVEGACIETRDSLTAERRETVDEPEATTSDQPSASGGSNIGKNNTEKGHPSCPSSSDQKLSVEGACIETRDSLTAERRETVDEPEAKLRDQPKHPLTEESDALDISTEPSEPGPSERKQPTKASAQEQIKEELSRINSEIVYIMNIKSSCGLSTDLKKKLKSSEKEKEQLEKRLKRKLTDAKAQATARRKKMAKLERLLTEAGEKIKHKPGRPRLEDNMEGLAEAIYSIVVPEGAADERRRTETINTIKTLDDLKGALEERGYTLSRSALYYRLIPANVKRIDGKHHFSTVNIKLCRPQNNQRKPHVDGHFATASVKYVKELASLFGGDNVFFLSQDDKARVPIGLPISKKQSLMLMHLDYKVTLPDHDFPIGENHKLIPSVYACCLPGKDGNIGYSGPTYVATRSAKHNKSSAESHMADFQQILTEDCFKEHSTNGDAVKPLVFISVDGGPDEAPKNTRTLLMWAATFKELNLDACFIFAHAPGSSAYNPVERRMAPLSKMTAGIILPFDSFGSHLNASNKTNDPVLEKKNFEAAGEILSQVFNEAEIDGYPVVSKFVSEVCEEVNDDLDEKWKSDHVLQSQYMCQIVKCLDTSCCRPFRTNYAEYFPDRFLPPPVPIKACAEGLKVENTGHFGSLFQALHMNKILNPHPTRLPLPGRGNYFAVYGGAVGSAEGQVPALRAYRQ